MVEIVGWYRTKQIAQHTYLLESIEPTKPGQGCDLIMVEYTPANHSIGGRSMRPIIIKCALFENKVWINYGSGDYMGLFLPGHEGESLLTMTVASPSREAIIRRELLKLI